MIQHNLRHNFLKRVFKKWALNRVLHFNGQNLLLNEHKPIVTLKTNGRCKKVTFIYLFFVCLQGLLRVWKPQIKIHISKEMLGMAWFTRGFACYGIKQSLKDSIVHILEVLEVLDIFNAIKGELYILVHAVTPSNLSNIRPEGSNIMYF